MVKKKSDGKKKSAGQKPPTAKQKETALKGQHSVRVALVKARVLTGSSIDEVAAIQDIKSAEEMWMDLGAIAPPYDPVSLMALYEVSNSLRQNVEAYRQNIEGFGHAFSPRIDLDKEGAEERVREAILIERLHDKSAEIDGMEDEGTKTPEQISELRDNMEIEEPSETEVKERIELLRGQIRQQLQIAQAWFQNCGEGKSFIELRKDKREDMEVIGHGAWEFLRDNRNRLRRIAYVPGFTVYPVKDEGKRTEVEEVDRISPIATRPHMNQRFFRKFVQKVNDEKRFFKSLGDPSIVSRKTGKSYKDIEEMKKAEDGNEITAHEMEYFDIHSPRTPAGVPRWIGNLIAVMGSRAADEVNYLLFDHKSVPPGIFFVKGGKLGPQTKDALKNFISSDLQGRDAFHKVLILELPALASRPGETPQLPDIQWKSLMSDQHKDATFTNYDKDNRNKLGSSFRQHPLLRGETVGEMNRATAWAILEFTDQQVYGPEREAFDWWINRVIMPEIGCPLIEFESNSPVTTNPDMIAKVMDVAGKYAALVPNEMRELLSQVFNKEYPNIDEDWAKNLPAIFTVAGLNPGGTPTVNDSTPEEREALIAGLQAKLAMMGIQLAGLKGTPLDDLPEVDDEQQGDLGTGDAA